jgi:uncharacterized protein YidB (DUF937 family)
VEQRPVPKAVVASAMSLGACSAVRAAVRAVALATFSVACLAVLAVLAVLWVLFWAVCLVVERVVRASAGGLGSLLEQFQRAGFAEQANSWVGTGQNLPLPPGAIGQVFGSDTLAQIAQQVGVTEAEAAEGLSQLLPEVVDRFTPEGKAPDLDQLAASVTALTRQFGG